MHDAREWAGGAVADAGRRARDGAGRCEPAKMGARMFAAPWPISSWFGLWRVPVMPSATTASQRLDRAEQAIVKAGPTSCITSATERSGQCSAGSKRGIPPKAVPIVATPGNCPYSLYSSREQHGDERCGYSPKAGNPVEDAAAGRDDE